MSVELPCAYLFPVCQMGILHTSRLVLKLKVFQAFKAT